MSKTPKSSAGSGGEAAEVPFETALKRLEGIVTAMESDDLPLETLLARYEEGVKLVEVCQARLAAAEVRLEQLEKTAAGELARKPVELPPDPAP
jgi:exodeoxyribonuclease VII small subunit